MQSQILYVTMNTLELARTTVAVCLKNSSGVFPVNSRQYFKYFVVNFCYILYIY